MALHDYAYNDGGFVFGQGEVTLSASTSSAAITGDDRSPVTPVRCDIFRLDPHTFSTTSVVATDFGLETCVLNDEDLTYDIGGTTPDPTGPTSLYLKNSRAKCHYGFVAEQNDKVVPTFSNANSGGTIVSHVQWRAAVSGNPNLGIEGARMSGGSPLGVGRMIHLGGSADTGATRSGKVQTSRVLALLYLISQALSDDLQYTTIKIDDHDHLTGTAVGRDYFDAEEPTFSFFGRVITKNNSITLTSSGGTSGFHTEGIVARIVG